VFSIGPVPKRYAWGSKTQLQGLFSLPANGEPLAEMWFSGHEESPSEVTLTPGVHMPLPQAIRNAPDMMVGPICSERFGPVLPYLFKVISARIPLSMQVHPVGFQARAGFNAENVAGVPLDSPVRSFKDVNEKSEMVVALTSFQASVGFASRAFALRNLHAVDHPLARRMECALGSRPRHDERPGEADFSEADSRMPIASVVWPTSHIRTFRAFHEAIAASADQASGLPEALAHARDSATSAKCRMAFDHAIAAAQAFPGDASVLTLLMMNPVSLDEGDSVFIPAGTPHAYIQGTGAEIMTNSDNVLRAGMTVKHRDIDNLLQCLNCASVGPIDPSDARLGTFIMRDIVFYRPPADEFMLAYGHVDGARRPWPILDSMVQRYGRLADYMKATHQPLPHRGPRVVLCTEGRVLCRSERDSCALAAGEAVFVPAGEGWLSVDAVRDAAKPEDSSGSFIVASTPF
jgi:mannose-6-phosphate isomerase